MSWSKPGADDPAIARRVLRDLFGSFGTRRLISMPKRADRRRRIDASLAQLDLSLNALDIEIFDGLVFSDAANFPNPGVRGCFISHMSLMRECAASGKPMLILEDDVEFEFARLAAFPDLAEAVATHGWDILYFGYLQPKKMTGTPRLAAYQGGTIGGHFYGVQPAFAGAISEFMERCSRMSPGDPSGGPMYRDGAFTLFRERNLEWKTELAVPSLARQFASRSDLTRKPYHRLPVIGSLAELAYSFKSRRQR